MSTIESINRCLSSHRYQMCKASKEDEEVEEKERDDEQRKLKIK